ncbi:hypothetical protein Y032_0026g1314 [Ancylostoma ceylanicum]|uniref:Uncharacterized protein n=1 Tax=Ancylostoma ceylanicum TaxID=53326 RepID=A0A016UTD3_9BILA|nr:hypothetical protein Y032_0026g1314 [Ancylostoma ceylanicum]
MDKKKNRQLHKLKKKINELFLLGGISEEEARAIDMAESAMIARSSSSSTLQEDSPTSSEIRELVQYSVIGPVVNKPKWAHFRPWKSTSQTIVIRINCPNDYIARRQ